MRPRSLLIAAAAVVTMLVLAACGGDDSSGGSGEPLTQEEFIAAADAICTEADEKSDALGEPESLDDATQLLRDGVAIFEEQLDGLRDLTPPEELSASMDRAVELLGQVNDSITEAADAFEAGELADAEEILDGIEPVSDELDQIAADIGLEACGSDSALG